MKRFAAFIAIASFATLAGADNVYQQFAQDNSDLSTQPNQYVGATQRGVGASVDRYQSWADGNSDLFGSPGAGITNPPMSDHQLPDVYRGFADDPDLAP